MSEYILSIKGTRVEKLFRLNRFFSSFFGIVVSILFWLIGAVAILGWIFRIFYPNDQFINLGAALILTAIFILFLAIRGFLIFFINNGAGIEPKSLKEIASAKAKANIFDLFSVPLAGVVADLQVNSKEINILALLKAIIKLPECMFVFARIGVAPEEFERELGASNAASGGNFINLAEQALKVAIYEKHRAIEIGDMLVALSETEANFARFLSSRNLTSQDLANIVYWQTTLEERIEKRGAFLDPSNLHLTGGIGRDWAFGYTPDLNRFARNLTYQIEKQGLFLDIIGHDKEIQALEEALNRSNGANAILVGEPGVGKKTTVLGFAKKVSEGQTLPSLAHKHVMELDLDLLVSGLTSSGEIVERLTRVFSQAANAGNIIIYVNNIERLFTSGDIGQVDATAVILPFLSYPELNFIGTADLASFNNFIAPNASLAQKFEKIEISEPNREEMIRILEDVAPKIEYHYKVLITYPAILETIKLADKYILDQPNPEKSIALLEGAAGSLDRNKNKLVDESIVDEYVSSKTSIPVKEATGDEREILINLEELLHRSIVNQEGAVKSVASALRRARTGVSDSKKPIGSFLFLGPTGVGKTETAKSLARAYFGSAETMIRFDMSEYQVENDIYRLIGTPAGSGENVEGELISQMRNKPFSLLLFDEIEKANLNILNLFLQILDEGFLTSSAGKKVYFKNSIIIATSNAGANLIRELSKKSVPYQEAKKQVFDYVQDQGIFKPEFLNRFTDVVYFSPLSEDQIKEVAKIMIRSLAEDIQRNKEIKLKVESAALAKLATLGYDPAMGARPMARVIEEQIKNFLAEKILRGEASKGSEVIFKLSDIK